MHAHPRLDEVPAVALLRDLQNPPRVAHGVVVADDTLLLEAQDILERSHEGHEGAAGLRRIDGEAGVVLAPVDLGEQRLAAASEVIPACRKSGGRRFCRVPNRRSMRPRPCGA